MPDMSGIAPALAALPPGTRGRLDLHIDPGAGFVPYVVPVHAIVGRASGPRVVVTAGVHGDEFEPVWACGLLLRDLDPKTLAGTVIVVPVAHPPAHAARSRRSPLDDADLNRTFPGDPDGLPTFRLAATLLREVVAGADMLIDLHSGGTRTVFAPMVGYRATPPATAAASHAASLAFGLPWLWRMSPDGGVFSYEASRLGVPSLGVEAGGRGGCRPEDVRVLHEGVVRVLRHLHMLPSVPDEPPAPQSLPVYEGGWTLSPATGLWQAHVALGAMVAAGQLLADILAPAGEIVAQVHAPHAGMVAAIRTFCAVDAGEWAVTVMAWADERIFATEI